LKYWDSSALVAFHVQQGSTAAMRDIYARDSDVLTWVLSDIEVRSSISRLGREGSLTQSSLSALVSHVEDFWESVVFVSMLEPVKSRAKRLLRTHAIRAADALQLGAALTAAYDDTRGQEFVCLDERLSAAALREGFTVLP